MEVTPALIPENEMERITALSLYNLDYDTLNKSFEDLTLLAAKITGAHVSLINLLDNYTQWTVGAYGLDIMNMPKEESVCQYTILDHSGFEVDDLASDDRFKHADYVKKGGLELKYYYGVPIVTHSGHNIGALCVMDSDKKKLSHEKKEMLQVLATTVITRLNFLDRIETLKQKVAELSDAKRMLSHDVRAPINGMIGLALLAGEDVTRENYEDIPDYLKLIADSGHSLLSLVEDILNAPQADNRAHLASDYYSVSIIKDKLNSLFTPRTIKKKITFVVNISEDTASVLFPKNRLLQIIGNLVSNAIKFTPEGGIIIIDMMLKANDKFYDLEIGVTDNGTGISKAAIKAILDGKGKSQTGTSGEAGYGLGLMLVKQIVDSLNGKMDIISAQGKGTTFSIIIPQITENIAIV